MPGVNRAAAARLEAAGTEIAGALAELVADWPRYAARYAVDPAGFAQLHTAVLVQYMAALLRTGDENYRHLYIGERVKQFQDRTVELAEQERRKATVLPAERRIFVDALAGGRDGQVLVNRIFDTIEHVLTASAAAEVTVLFVGDCLFHDMISFLTAPLLEDGVRLRPTFITAHNAAKARAAAAALADQRFDLVAYSPFTYAFNDDYGALQRPRGLLAPRRYAAQIAAAVREAAETFDVLADLFDCPIVAHLPAPILRHSGARRERALAAPVLPGMRQANRMLARNLRARAADRNARGQIVHLLDEASLAQPDLWRAGEYLYKSPLQHPAAFGAMLAPAYRDIIMVVGRMRKRKLVVCDLDNTLWQGVIGEGLGVVHHYDRQEPLLTLKRRGVVLAINSKNDPAKAVWAAPEGRLSLDDFVARQINWDPKTINMRRIAEHLNLKDKDFVFIDDRADERAMMEQHCRAMLTLDALDPRSWRLMTLWADLLPATPGADRSDFYRQRDARQAFIAGDAHADAVQRDALYRDLRLQLVIREADAADVARVAELVNRTNQFNMAESRVTKRQVEQWVARADAHVLIADASDRFGAMGTIAVLVVEQTADGLGIPVFVLSCRVFGYGMEFALLEQARRFARAGDDLFGALVETPFNQPCRDVYPTAGFHAVAGGWVYRDAAAAPIAFPSWLAVDAPRNCLADQIA